MKHFDIPQINTPSYWDTAQTAFDYGLRQQKYSDLSGTGESICELGCGLSPFLSKEFMFNQKVGIDFSTKTIKTARELYPEVDYICADVTNTELPDKYFDVTVSGEVIEHLEKPELLIEEMVRLTKRRIIISTPNLEFDDPEHLWEFSEEDLWNMLSPYGDVSTHMVESNRFKGRKYIFAICDLN